MMFGNCYDKETDAACCDPGYNSNIRALSPAETEETEVSLPDIQQTANRAIHLLSQDIVSSFWLLAGTG